MSLKPKQVDFQETWQQIQLIVNEVISVRPITKNNWSDCFTNIYSLCVSYPDCHLEQLYQSTCELLVDHVTRLRRKLSQGDAFNLLQFYADSWQNYKQGAEYLNILYSYFNRESLSQQLPAPSTDPCHPVDMQLNNGVHLMEIYQLAMRLWRTEMVDHVIQDVVQIALVEFNNACLYHCQNLLQYVPATSHPVSLQEVEWYNVIGYYNMSPWLPSRVVEVEKSQKSLPLQLYQDTLETPLLLLVSTHCQQYSSQLLAQDNYSAYLLQAGAKLDEMVQQFADSGILHCSTTSKLAAVCEERLVKDHLGYLHSAVNVIVQNETISELSNLCKLLNRVDGALEPLVTAFEEHVKKKGLAVVASCLSNKGDVSSNFVASVLSIQTHYLSMVMKVFGGHCSFQSAFDRACRAFVNMKSSPSQHPKAPFILSRYCDHAFRKGVRSTCDPDGNWINDAITVFKYIDDKDIFQKCYSKALAKRLIYALSRSNEAEEDMIHQLRRCCGCQYVCSLQRMLLDINLSADVMDKFASYLKSTDSKLDVSFSTLVLQSGSWPLPVTNHPIPMATELVIPLQTFEQFYKGQFSGKNLTWIMSSSSGELRMTYLEKPYTLCASAHHMSVLLAFNSALCHSISFLMEHTSLDKAELMKTIQSLIDNKLLLVKEENSVCVGDMTASSQLILNTNYSNKRTKFKVTSYDSHDTVQETEQAAQGAVDADRKLFLQAVIVRVMKSRKVLKHNLLIQEVISLASLHFSPTVAIIKSVIEALIDKQYIRRSDTSPNEYHYLA